MGHDLRFGGPLAATNAPPTPTTGPSEPHAPPHVKRTWSRDAHPQPRSMRHEGGHRPFARPCRAEHTLRMRCDVRCRGRTWGELRRHHTSRDTVSRKLESTGRPSIQSCMERRFEDWRQPRLRALILLADCRVVGFAPQVVRSQRVCRRVCFEGWKRLGGSDWAIGGPSRRRRSMKLMMEAMSACADERSSGGRAKCGRCRWVCRRRGPLPPCGKLHARAWRGGGRRRARGRGA